LARTTQQHYRSAMSLLRHDDFWEAKVMTCSALQRQGIEDIWKMISDYADASRANGAFDEIRAEQNLSWMRQLVDELLLDQLAKHPRVREALPTVEADVRSAAQTPLAAAQAILALSSEPQ